MRPRYGFDIAEDDRISTIVNSYDSYPSIIDYLKALSLKPKALVANRRKKSAISKSTVCLQIYEF